MKIRAFITHKLKEHYSECQDRFCINCGNHAIAVSDGMSQSVFSDYWAEILSSFYAKNGHCTNEDRKELCNDWLRKVEDFINEEIHNGKKTWRLQNCIDAQNGAGATLCGIQFKDAKKWVGHVLGDTCIIEVDMTGKEPIKILTSEKKAFDSYPDYYESFPNKEGRGQIEEFEGVLSDGHCLLLVSDPFSEFLSKHKEHCSQWLTRILELKGHEDYCSLVDDWRQEGLHNDDSTLCIIEPNGSMDFYIEKADDIHSLIKGEAQSTAPLSNIHAPEESVANAAEAEKVGVVIIPTKSKSPEKQRVIEAEKQEFVDYAHSQFETIVTKAKPFNSCPRKEKKLMKKGSYINLNVLQKFHDDMIKKFDEIMDAISRKFNEE